MHVPEVHCRMVIWTCVLECPFTPLVEIQFHWPCSLRSAGLSQGHAHVYSATALVLAPRNFKLRICGQYPKPSMAPPSLANNLAIGAWYSP